MIRSAHRLSASLNVNRRSFASSPGQSALLRGWHGLMAFVRPGVVVQNDNSYDSNWKPTVPWVSEHDPKFRPRNMLWIDGVFRDGRLGYALKWATDRQVLVRELRHIEVSLRLEFYPRVNLQKVIPSWKEGGAVLYFDSVESAQRASKMQVGRLLGLKNQDIRIFTVEGAPFTEDLRAVATRVIELRLVSGKPLTLETVYSQTRRFGRIRSVELREKDTIARVKFAKREDAVAAAKCLHRKHLCEGDCAALGLIGKEYHAFTEDASHKVLTVRYVPPLSWPDVLSLVKQPRISILILAAGMAVLSFFIITPLRNYLVTQTLVIGHRAGHHSNEKYVWSECDSGSGSSTSSAGSEGSSVNSASRTVLGDRLREVCADVPSGVTIVCGLGMGTPLSDIMSHLVHNKRNTVVIPCGEASSAHDFTNELETAIGFSPSFSTLHSAQSYLESVLTLGTKGTKANDDSVENSQLETVLNTLSNCLYVLSWPSKRGDAFPVVVFDGMDALISKGANDPAVAAAVSSTVSWAAKQAAAGTAHVILVVDDTFAFDQLMAHAYTGEEALDTHRTNVLYGSQEPRDAVSDFLRQRLFAAVRRGNPAGATSGTTVDGVSGLLNGIDDRYRSVIEDLVTPEGQWTPDGSSVVSRALEIVGGRIADVERLADAVDVLLADHSADGKIRGQDLYEKATETLITEASRDLKKRAFGSRPFSNDPPSKDALWTPYMYWRVVNALLGRDKKLASDTFTGGSPNAMTNDLCVEYGALSMRVCKGNESVMQQLVANRLLRVCPHVHEDPDRQGTTAKRCASSLSPLMQACLTRLADDHHFSSAMKSTSLLVDLKKLAAEISSVEAELSSLSNATDSYLPGTSDRRYDLDKRLRLLSEKSAVTEEALREAAKESPLAPKASWM